MNGHRLQKSIYVIVIACGLALLSCGDDGGGGGTAGEAAVPGGGEPCTGSCTAGFVCQNSGRFIDICSSGCNTDAACGLLQPGIVCIADHCVLGCTGVGTCPGGGACVDVDGRMACVSGG